MPGTSKLGIITSRLVGYSVVYSACLSLWIYLVIVFLICLLLILSKLTLSLPYFVKNVLIKKLLHYFTQLFKTVLTIYMILIILQE